MNDRELEARLWDLYRARVPADDVAPMGLRSELAVIARAPSGRISGSRTWALLAAAALLAATLIGGALIAGSGLLRSIAIIVPPTDASPMATPSPSHDPWWHIPRGWPAMRAGPAGLYTWDPYGVYNWAHKVPARLVLLDGVKDSVELVFRVTTEPRELEAMSAALASYGDGPYPEQPIEIPSLAVETWVDESGASAVNGVTVQPGAPGASLWKRTQTWLLRYNGRVIAFDITSYPDTAPALIAEAEAAIRSVRPERPDPAATPVPSGYPSALPRFIFELTQGWDSG
jgi:hypothetical protein